MTIEGTGKSLTSIDDYSTDVNKVRLLISDTDYTNLIFSDEQIEAYLALEENEIYHAAAMAIETIATNQALTLKVLELLNLKTDGAKLADSLRKHAYNLRKRAYEQPVADIASMNVGTFSEREILIRDAVNNAV